MIYLVEVNEGDGVSEIEIYAGNSRDALILAAGKYVSDVIEKGFSFDGYAIETDYSNEKIRRDSIALRFRTFEGTPGETTPVFFLTSYKKGERKKRDVSKARFVNREKREIIATVNFSGVETERGFFEVTTPDGDEYGIFDDYDEAENAIRKTFREALFIYKVRVNYL